ncbi:MAG: hypothetical protein JNM22_05625 [Saprospiraceae bacterium]|nr:hypothetical protein [Saprospiraceae bacterium]
MRNITVIIALLFSLAAQAQTPIVSLRTEKGGGDTIFLVDSSKRVFPDGRIVVEELWVPVVGVDSLKNYLKTIENVYSNADLEIERQKVTRANAKKELKRIQKELEGQDAGKPGTRTVLKEPVMVAVPNAQPDQLVPGEYIWDGEKLIPKPQVKKTKGTTKKKG